MLTALALAALLGLAILAVVAGRWALAHAVVHAGTALAALALLGVGLGFLLGAVQPGLVLPLGLPWLPARLHVDNLSALFLVIVNLPASAAALFGVGYVAHLPERRRVTPLLPLFLLAMNLVLLADDAFTFLVAWESMSLASWLMVVAGHESADNRRAGMVYLIMAVFGTFCLLAAFGLLAGADGHYGFAAMRAAPPKGVGAVLVTLLVLAGAGSKAGLAPLHVWLPLAHPAAPSHISALMSGVMTKVALYGLIRLLFDLHGPLGWQWGLALMMIGAFTAVLGVLHALLQDDMKALLAYSTIENIGVVVIGLGLAIAFRDGDAPTLAALALVASLYHMLNHAVFKTLLFLGAGAVISATGERRLGLLGGLLKRMKWTGAAFLVGAAAISALPPLNGFVSEWLIFQSLFKGPAMPHWAMKFGVPVVGALLALAGALAATCFVRAFGIAFLGRPRSAAAAAGHEVGRSMRVAMVALAVLCVVLGAIPVTVTDALARVAQPLTGVSLAVSGDLGWPWLAPVSSMRGSYSGTILVLTGLALFAVTIWVVHRLGIRDLRRAEPWDCGHPEDSPTTQYSGQSFAQPLRRVFGHTLLHARESVAMPEPGDLGPARHQASVADPVWAGLYRPVIAAVDWIADHVNHLQYLTVRGYLLLMFLTLVFMLLLVAGRQQL